MKQNNLIKIFTSFLIIISISVFGKENRTNDFIVGKIEFLGKSGRDGVVLLISPEKAYLLNKGVLLTIKRVNKEIVLKIVDAEGIYLRCELNSKTETALLTYGEDVFYSDSFNSSIKYRDAKMILSQLIKIYEDFILKIESTEDPAIIANAIKNFSTELDKLLPEMKRVNDKYPELKKFKHSPPPELTDESALLEVLEPRLRDAFFKIQMFISAENVKKATGDLQKVLQKMDSGR